MTYLFENLSDQRFQEFCQALLARTFPRIQCLPAAQRDGGRDAVSYYPEEGKSFIVFQVKFVRTIPAEPHKWLTHTVEAEAPKMNELIPKGAREYYLLTNVPGTAFPESGSIDRVQQLLKKHIPVPSFCWWREDLSRRLDDAWGLKWTYLELLSGADAFGYLIGNGLSEDRERRTSAIRAFVRDQYDADEKIRFKQVDMQNRLLDLFIDVPIAFRRATTREQRQLFVRLIQSMRNEPNPPYYPYEERELVEIGTDGEIQRHVFYEGRDAVGAATMLLHPLVQKRLKKVVLEGAPGQGKSTIAQYVCQVQRMILLDKTADLAELPEEHRRTSALLPIKVDLRDFATWLRKINPFSASGETLPNNSSQRSLETFLAALISHHSGGAEFTPSDLWAVSKLSPVLLLLDGLDEVADISMRQKVVDEIIRVACSPISRQS
jgi:hypothetical protein